MRIIGIAIAAAGLLLAACSSGPQQAQIVTCDSFSAALLTVNALDDAGKVPESAKPSVRKAVALAAPVCGKDAQLLNSTPAAIADLTQAMTALEAVIAQSKNGG